MSDAFAHRTDLAAARERQGRRDPGHQQAWRQFNQERANLVRERLKVSEVVGTSVTLKKVSGAEFVGLCPFHGEKTPSFTVSDKKGFFHCFGCGAHGNVIDFVMRHRDRTFVEAIEILESENGLRHLRTTAPAPPRPAVKQVEERQQDDWLLQVWQATVEVRPESFVDQYLRSRGLVPPADYGQADPGLNGAWPVDLRMHLELWHKPSRQAFPAMILPYRKGGPDGEIVALHRTWLRRDGSGKADVTPNKMHVGRRKGALIYLAPIADHMVAGEGVETSLSCMQLWKLPGYCYGSADAMAAVEPPFLVERLVIGADWNSGNRTGEKAADTARKAYSTGGRSIAIKVPPLRQRDKADFNDVVQMMTRGEWPPASAKASAGTPAGPKAAPPPTAKASPQLLRRSADDARDLRDALRAAKAEEEACFEAYCRATPRELEAATRAWKAACARTESLLKRSIA